MAVPDDTEKSVAEKDVGANFRRELPDNSDFEIDVPFPERSGLFDWLGCETQTDARRRLGDGSHQRGGQQPDKSLIGSNGESPPHRGQIQLGSLWAENCSRLASKFMNPIA
jgi:hypothetical protein